MSAMNSYSASLGDAKAFGRVAVMFGGSSAERAVSLMSGQAVLDALLSVGVDAYAFDPSAQAFAEVLEYDRVFIVLHGRGGEDGTMQGALDVLGIPYTGSGVLGSALGMDKVRSKRIWQAMNLPTPNSVAISNLEGLMDATLNLKFPVMVKPASEGSSIGMARVARREELKAACQVALQSDPHVLIEEWVDGPEYTCAVIDSMPLPLIRLKTENEFYDYQAKYESDSTEYLCPCGLDEQSEAALKRLAVFAFDALAASGWGRVDLMCDSDGNPWLLEINTVPGMTSHSLVPMAAAAAGMNFSELCWRILETTFDHTVVTSIKEAADA